MSNEISATSTDWINWASQCVKQESGIILGVVPTEPLQTPDVEQLEADPIYWIQIAVAWSGYNNTQVTFWLSVQEKLETQYTSAKDRLILGIQAAEPKTPHNKAEAIARVQLSGLREAIATAKNNARRWTSDYYASIAIRDLSSRALTARESDRRITPR